MRFSLANVCCGSRDPSVIVVPKADVSCNIEQIKKPKVTYSKTLKHFLEHFCHDFLQFAL